MSAGDVLSVMMFVAFIGLIFTGFPVAWLLGGLSVLFTALGIFLHVDFQLPILVSWDYTSLTVDRIWDVMNNWVLVALPMFIFMGLMLDKSGVAERLMQNLVKLFGSVRAVSSRWRLLECCWPRLLASLALRLFQRCLVYLRC